MNVLEAKAAQVGWKLELAELKAHLSALEQMPIARHLRFAGIIMIERRRREIFCEIRAQRRELIKAVYDPREPCEDGPGARVGK